MAKKDIDIDEEVRRLSRKTNVGVKKREYAYENQLKRLDKQIDEAISDKIKAFDENQKSTQDYKDIEFKHDTINRYREKLRKI